MWSNKQKVVNNDARLVKLAVRRITFYINANTTFSPDTCTLTFH